MTQQPTLFIAGKDRSKDWGHRIKQSASQRKGPTLLAETHSESSAIALRDTANQDEYLTRYLDLLRSRYTLRNITRPPKGGPFIKALIQKYRKFVTFGHAQILAEQSQINEVIIMGLRFQQDENQKRINTLETQIQTLLKEHTGKSQ